MNRPRVLLADDHTLLLEAFRKLLADDCDIVGTAADGRALLAAAAELKPDVVILDVAMPILNGLDAARQLTRLHPAVRIVFLTMNEDPELAAEAFSVGASGYLLKKSAASELRTAIRKVMSGQSYVTPLVGDRFDGSLGHPAGRRPIDLTDRQREIVQLVAEGRSMKQVGGILAITPRTVAFHKYRIMKQLNLKTTADLIQYAIKRRMV